MADSTHAKQVRSKYNNIAKSYDRRYQINPLSGVAQALRDIVIDHGARQVLEVGCGTGQWLKILAPYVERIVGLDLSSGMLSRARNLTGPISLVCGSANSLPFFRSSFDFIFVVNALHQFDDKKQFIEHARQLLRPTGTLATVVMDTAFAVGQWVVYDYFPGALEFDQARFPRLEQIASWMEEAGLTSLPPRVVEPIISQTRGRSILDDYFIQRQSSSTLMGLSDAQYEAGINRIKSAITEAEAQGGEAIFRTEFQLVMIVGRFQK